MARNKHPEETVEKILAVSAKLFMEKGYEHTTLLENTTCTRYRHPMDMS